VVFRVFDLNGNLIAVYNQGLKIAGDHTFDLNCNSLQTGIYNVVLNVNGTISSKKITVMK